MSKNTNRDKAFSLAEVVIVVGIIGLIAELTLPELISKFQEQVYKVAYKKAFSVASQAWTSAVLEYNIVERPTWTDGATRVSNFNAFKQYIKVAKDCNNNNNSQCWDSSGEKYCFNFPDNSAPAFLDASGMAWSINTDAASNINGAELLLDTNGLKKPNKYGQDRFILLPYSSDSTNIGLPVKILPHVDSTYDVNVCPSGTIHPCYYTSWLYD
ncbi:MAG: type II secretion system protein [bacterium]